MRNLIAKLTTKLLDREPKHDTSAARYADAEAEIARWKACAENEARRRQEVFVACQDLERQRNQWIALYHKQAEMNANGQVYLGKIIEMQKVQITSAYVAINQLRAQLNLPPYVLEHGKTFTGEPLTKAREFVEEQRALLAQIRATFATYDGTNKPTCADSATTETNARTPNGGRPNVA